VFELNQQIELNRTIFVEKQKNITWR